MPVKRAKRGKTMAEDNKNARHIALDHQTTKHIEQKIDALQKTVSTSHVENKLKGVTMPTNSGGSTSGATGQSGSGNQRK
jgi:hypothetical protein